MFNTKKHKHAPLFGFRQIHLTSTLTTSLSVFTHDHVFQPGREEELAFKLERASSRYTLLMERLLRLLLHTLLIMTLERGTGVSRRIRRWRGLGYVEGELALKSPSGSKVSFVCWQTLSTPVTVPNENLFQNLQSGRESELEKEREIKEWQKQT